MKAMIVLAALAILGLGAAPAALAAMPTRPNALKELPQAKGRLSVTSPAFRAGGDIPFENTQYRGNIFPGLAWSAGPTGTRSYAIIMQDIDAARNGEPILHWTMYNLPAATTGLPAGMKPDAKPQGSSYGPNVRGTAQPYLGPHPPPGPKHHYHLQVFALDTMLTVNPAMTYDQLLGAMRGHVLADGELVGMAQFDAQSKK